MSDEKTKLNVDDLMKDENGKYVLPLLKPVQFGDELVKELKLDEPKARHIRKMPATPTTNDVLKVCADLANMSDSFIDDLSLKDVTRLAEYFESFS